MSRKGNCLDDTGMENFWHFKIGIAIFAKVLINQTF